MDESELAPWETDGTHPWETDGDLPWETSDTEWAAEAEAEDAWRGEADLADWPEDGAGPEYWMWKHRDENP